MKPFHRDRHTKDALDNRSRSPFRLSRGIAKHAPGKWPDDFRGRARKAVTLVELLVVVTILMMLAAFAIPVMRPMTEGRRIREAARAIDVFLAQAKTRALVSQRPAGILFERIQQIDAAGNVFYEDDACNILRLVEVPPPYAGDFADSRVRIQNWTTVVDSSGTYPRIHHPNFPNHFVLKLAVRYSHLGNRLLRWGDRVQFSHHGPFFTIVNDPIDDTPTSIGADFVLDPDGYILFDDPDDSTYPTYNTNTLWVTSHVLTVIAPATDMAAVSYPLTISPDAPPVVAPGILLDSGRPLWSADLPFQFYRQPQPVMSPPLQLPRNTVVDLGDSGYYIGLPDANPATPRIDGLSDIYDPPNDNTRLAFETYEDSSGQFKQFPDAFGRIGDTGYPVPDNRGPMILFDPSGTVHSVYHWKADTPTDAPSYGYARVTRPIFLMVGKRERTGHEPVTASGTPLVADPAVRSLAEDGLHNWQDASNIWIAVNPTNGFVTSAAVNTNDASGADFVTPSGISVPGDPTATDPGNLGAQMQISRAYARQAQISMGALQE